VRRVVFSEGSVSRSDEPAHASGSAESGRRLCRGAPFKAIRSRTLGPGLLESARVLRPGPGFTARPGSCRRCAPRRQIPARAAPSTAVIRFIPVLGEWRGGRGTPQAPPPSRRLDLLANGYATIVGPRYRDGAPRSSAPSTLASFAAPADRSVAFLTPGGHLHGDQSLAGLPPLPFATHMTIPLVHIDGEGSPKSRADDPISGTWAAAKAGRPCS